MQEYVKTKGNGQEAALRVYDTKIPVVARNIASQNLNKPLIKEELERILQKPEMRIENFTGKLAQIAQETPMKGYTGSDVIEANKTILKLHGVLTDKKQITTYNLHTELTTMSEHELLQLRKRKQLETDKILSDDS